MHEYLKHYNHWLASDALSEEEKTAILRAGLAALRGEEDEI